MTRWLLVLWLMTGGCGWASIVEGGSGLLYGPHFSYWLTAPHGWMLDNESGMTQGSNAVFYPKGQTWSNAPVVFYTNSWLKTPGKKTPGQVALGEVADFHANGSPNYTGSFDETWNLPHGRHADIWRFQGDQWGNFEAIAYIPEKKTINFVVITARTKKLFDEAWPSFRELVFSYEWMTDDVKFDKSKAPAPAK